MYNTNCVYLNPGITFKKAIHMYVRGMITRAELCDYGLAFSRAGATKEIRNRRRWYVTKLLLTKYRK